MFPGLTSLRECADGAAAPRGELLDFWRAESALDVYDERAMELLQDVGLASFADTRRRAAIWPQACAGDRDNPRPRSQLLLLDEPTAGMSHEDVVRTMALIRSVSAGRTVLMVEHNLSVVAGLCEYVTVMTRGCDPGRRQLCRGLRNPDVIAAYIGVADA